MLAYWPHPYLQVYLMSYITNCMDYGSFFSSVTILASYLLYLVSCSTLYAECLCLVRNPVLQFSLKYPYPDQLLQPQLWCGRTAIVRAPELKRIINQSINQSINQQRKMKQKEGFLYFMKKSLLSFNKLVSVLSTEYLRIYTVHYSDLIM